MKEKNTQKNSFSGTFKKHIGLFVEFGKMSWINLVNQKVRTFLTSSAITIGVVLILIMVSLGIGVNDWLVAQITGQMDVTTVMVITKQLSSRPMVRQMMGSPEEEEEDKMKEPALLNLETIDSFMDIPGVVEVIPLSAIAADSATIEGHETPMLSPSVSAMKFKQDDIYVKELLAGDYMEVNENTDKALITTMGLRFAGIEDTDYDKLIGRKLTITVPTKVSPTGFLSTTVESEDMDFYIAAVVDVGIDNNQIMINVDRATEILASATDQTPGEYLSKVGYMSVMVKTDSTENTEDVSKTIRALGFTTSTTEDVIRTINEILKVMQVVLSLFGVIALIVATLGIANTMIMSIYERTKDIGILKAIGASKGNIRVLFLIESALIGLFGGIAGVMLGYLFTPLINIGLTLVMANMNISPGDSLFVMPWWLTFGTLGFSIFIAILAGIYPANKAAKLDPIKAIKYE